ncbi:unnamed protein product [Gulo gulo]|uniref:Uncharacterized protein n=1 Tax=Gulo gulo TaxID=48420 RepID=A0A9X9PYP8_GULGU|nr:unnamed protein product [Gulo gulo]
MHPQDHLHLASSSSRCSTAISLPSAPGPEDPLSLGPAARLHPRMDQLPSKCWYKKSENPRGTIKMNSPTRLFHDVLSTFLHHQTTQLDT